MKTLEQQLAQYAAYHQDARNIATHFIGIPLIFVAVIVLLSRPSVQFAAFTVSPALVGALLAAAYYLVLDRPLGVIMAVLLGLSVWFGAFAAGLATGTWLSIGLGAFLVGWVFQFVGHFWEGSKPAFVDDLVGLIIGPLFVVAEVVFFLGLRKPLQQAMLVANKE